MIEKITDQNLERYDSRLKEWCDRKFFEKGNYGKYQTTEESSIVAFYPAPNTPLEGKVKFSFKETPPTLGDKGPENPSTITGVSSVNVLSFEQDLYNPTDLSYEMYEEYQLLPDGCIQFDAENNGSSVLFLWYYTNPISGNYVDDDLTLILDLKDFSASDNASYARINLAPSGDSRFQFYADINIGYPGREAYKSIPGIYTLPFKLVPDSKEQYFFRTIATIESGHSIHAKYRLIVAKTSSLHPYTISLGSTYYGGEIDLATGLMTVTWVGKILDRSSLVAASAGFTWNGTDKLSKRLFFRLNGTATGFPAIKDITHITCSHFRKILNDEEDSVQSNLTFGTFYVNSVSSKWIMFYDNDMVVIDESKTVYENAELLINWFEAKKQAGDPVYLVYELKEPQIVQLSPLQLVSLAQTDKYTPRLNTVYTDADSIQISYLKSPIRDEYEKTQAILSLGGNS